MAETLDISFENSRGQNYPRIDYKWWYALAEFIDNSTQNYFDNREALDAFFLENGDDFTVEIVRDEDLIRISDNAFGMDLSVLTRAMNVSTPPPIKEGKKIGRSRYGVGMKTASGWAGRFMTIRTTMLGSGKQITVKLDWQKVNAGTTKLDISTREVDETDHGTIIELTGIYDIAKGNTVKTMKNYLGSIYRLDIRNEDLVLKWDGDPLKPFSFSDTTDFQLKPNNSPWTKEVNGKVNNKSVNGWFGVLKKGKAARSKAGFSIFHNNRMVEGWPSPWRPSQIFGGDDSNDGANNLLNQRLVGEVHLDDFGISHTKDGIYWKTGEEEGVGNYLKEQLDDLIKQAKIPYKGQTGGSKAQRKTFEQAAKSLQTEIKDIEEAFKREVTLLEVKPPLPSTQQKEINSMIVTQAANKSESLWSVDLGNYSVELYLENEGQLTPYYVNSVSEGDATTVFVVVNLDHPFYEGNDLDTANLNLRHAVMDAISEYAAGRLSRDDHTLVNFMKDQFLRLEWKENNS